MALLGKPLIAYKSNQITTKKAISVYKVIFHTLTPILRGNAEPRDTETEEFKSQMEHTLKRFRTTQIDIWTAVDEIVDYFTTQNTEE